MHFIHDLFSRAKEKLKLRQKKLDARQNNVKLGPSRKELKHSKMSQSNCKVRVAIDLSFDDLMNDKVCFLPERMSGINF